MTDQYKPPPEPVEQIKVDLESVDRTVAPSERQARFNERQLVLRHEIAKYWQHYQPALKRLPQHMASAALNQALGQILIIQGISANYFDQDITDKLTQGLVSAQPGLDKTTRDAMVNQVKREFLAEQAVRVGAAKIPGAAVFYGPEELQPRGVDALIAPPSSMEHFRLAAEPGEQQQRLILVTTTLYVDGLDYQNYRGPLLFPVRTPDEYMFMRGMVNQGIANNERFVDKRTPAETEREIRDLRNQRLAIMARLDETFEDLQGYDIHPSTRPNPAGGQDQRIFRFEKRVRRAEDGRQEVIPNIQDEFINAWPVIAIMPGVGNRPANLPPLYQNGMPGPDLSQRIAMSLASGTLWSTTSYPDVQTGAFIDPVGNTRRYLLPQE